MLCWHWSENLTITAKSTVKDCSTNSSLVLSLFIFIEVTTLQPTRHFKQHFGGGLSKPSYDQLNCVLALSFPKMILWAQRVLLNVKNTVLHCCLLCAMKWAGCVARQQFERHVYMDISTNLFYNHGVYDITIYFQLYDIFHSCKIVLFMQENGWT